MADEEIDHLSDIQALVLALVSDLESYSSPDEDNHADMSNLGEWLLPPHVVPVAIDSNYSRFYNDGSYYDPAPSDDPASEYWNGYGFPISESTNFDLLKVATQQLSSAYLTTNELAKMAFENAKILLLEHIASYVDGAEFEPEFFGGSVYTEPVDGGTAGASVTVSCGEEPVVEEPEPACPPPCSGDPMAITPNWTKLTEKEPFLNGKTCEYSIVLRTVYDATGMENLYSDPDYLTQGIEKLLSFYGKDDSPESIQLCIDGGATIKDTFVSTRSYVKMKALIVVPYDILNSIDEKAPSDMPDRKSQPAYVVIKGEDFLQMVRQTTRGMNIMAVNQSEWFWNSEGRLSDPTFNPAEEAKQVRAFKTEILKLFRKNDFRIKKPATFAKKWIEEFEIGFNADMGVDYVKALEKGCDKPELLTKGFSAFVSSEPQTLARTMYYVSQLPEMWELFTCQEPIEYGDWVVQYTASPPITIEIESPDLMMEEPTFCPDGSTSAVEDEGAFNLGDEFAELGKSIMDEIKSFPQAYAKRFGDTMCASLEGKRKNDVSMDDLGMLAARAADTALRQFFAGDRFLEHIPEWLAGINDADDLYDNILDHLGLCGLLSLIEMAFGCLFAGLSAEDAQRAMIEAAFRGMSDANFQKIFVGLPPDVQAQVFGTIDSELQSIPPPWDADYRVGSYSGQGTTATLNDDRSPSVKGDTYQAQVTESGFDSTYAEEETGEEGVIVGATTGVVINEAAIGRSYGNAGSVGTAADNITDTIVAAYRDALLNWISNGSIEDLDMLGEKLSKIPGAGIVTSILDQMDCPPLPWFTPPLGNFLQTLELGICPGHFAITLPRFTLDVSIGDIWAIIVNVAKELIKELVVQLIVLILKKILEIIFEALCALLEMIGSALIDAITGGNQIKEAIGESLCSDASDEQIDEAVRQMMEATGLSRCSSPEDVPTTEDAAEFVEIIAAVLTNSEVLDLLSGEATDEVKQMVTDVVNERIPSLSCMQPSDLARMFSALGKIVNPDIIEQAQFLDGGLPVCESICASPTQLERFNDIRCQIMQDKGLTPEQCEEQIDALTERAKQDLADLANILQGGPFQSFPPLTGGECPESSGVDSPFAPGSSIIPDMPEEVADVAKDVVTRVFENISNKHLRDLVGKRGFFDMVLSDSNGASLKEHKALVRSLMGEANTSNLELFQFYTDNWINETETDVSDASPSFNSDRGSAGSWGPFDAIDIGTGGFPLHVASRLQCYFAAYNQNYDFYPSQKKRIIDSKGVTVPMRGDSIDYNYLDTTSNSCRGLPWALSLDQRYELVKKLELNYEDYDKNDEGYAMRAEAKTALKEAGSNWDDTNRSEVVIYEKFGDNEEEETQRFVVTSEITSGAQALIDSLDISSDLSDMPLDEAVFGEFLSSVVKNYNDYSGSSTDDMKSKLRSALPHLQDVYMRKFSLLLASNQQGAVSPAPTSYSYGYNVGQNAPVAVYMGGPLVSDKLIADNPDWYTGTGKLASDQTKVFERFGGSYYNPPYYMEPPERQGWLGIMDKFVPPPDACDPVDGSEPREPICKFEDLADVYTDLMTKYKDDPRLFVRPGSSCGHAVPFNEIFTRGGAAGVDSTILATLRIYIVEALLRGMPVFSVYGSECFDEILSSYVVKSIEDNLRIQPVWGLPTQNYYYLFMEQVVQMYGRQIDQGLVPNPEEGSALQQALNYLNDLQTTFEAPTNVSNPKNYKIAYQISRNAMISKALNNEADTGEPGIRTILSYLILSEFKNMSKSFENSLYPSGMPVPTVPSVFFGNASFTQGASDSSNSLSWESNILDVWNGKGGDQGASGESNIFEPYLWQSLPPNVTDGGPYPALAQGWAGTGGGVGNSPFRLEKYIRLNEKDSYDSTISTIVQGRDDRFKGVVGTDSLQEWLSSLEDQTMPMSELFESVQIGYRLVFTTSPSAKGNQDWSGSDEPFDIAIAIKDVVNTMTDTQIFEKTLKVPVYKGAYSLDSFYRPHDDTDYMYMIPIASAELSLDLESPVSGFTANARSRMEADHACLLDTLAASDAYQAVFGVSIPFKKMLSLLAIYAINNFLPSIGWSEDGWAREGGAWMGMDDGFRSWDQRTFIKSKREVKKAFMQFYHSTDPTYEDEEQKAEKKRIRMGEKPKPSGNPGWRWWRLKTKIRKPTDKNGIICP